ncbi:MAG: CoA transferase, partial [Alphaproteobacteria bacterium]|nr:CoA transferase [Alphaproteobacteria bacterium]
MNVPTLTHSILKLGNRAPRNDDRLEIAGTGDPVFPTPFRIATAASAVLGAAGLVLSDLWRLRGNAAQSVRIDTRSAAASLRSSVYVTRDGVKPKFWDPLVGHYRTRDSRHIFLHTNHAHHRAAALRLSGATGDTRADLESAVAKLDAFAFETALAAEDGIGAVTRTRGEWNASAQGKSIAALPLFTIDKIGEAPPRKLPDAARP